MVVCESYQSHVSAIHRQNVSGSILGNSVIAMNANAQWFSAILMFVIILSRFSIQFSCCGVHRIYIYADVAFILILIEAKAHLNESGMSASFKKISLRKNNRKWQRKKWFLASQMAWNCQWFSLLIFLPLYAKMLSKLEHPKRAKYINLFSARRFARLQIKHN